MIWANSGLSAARRLTAVPAVCEMVLDTLSAHKYLHADPVDHHRRIQLHSDHRGSTGCYSNQRSSVDAHGQTGFAGDLLLGIMGSAAGRISLLFFNSG